MRYQVHRIKDFAFESFRWSPHSGGTAIVKPKDYQSAEQVDAATPYEAWMLAARKNAPLRAGDVLESLDDSRESGTLVIAKYIGFEPAQWWVPSPKPDAPVVPGQLQPDQLPPK
jgi:hypothetical protein